MIKVRPISCISNRCKVENTYNISPIISICFVNFSRRSQMNLTSTFPLSTCNWAYKNENLRILIFKSTFNTSSIHHAHDTIGTSHLLRAPLHICSFQKRRRRRAPMFKTFSAHHSQRRPSEQRQSDLDGCEIVASVQNN